MGKQKRENQQKKKQDAAAASTAPASGAAGPAPTSIPSPAPATTSQNPESQPAPVKKEEKAWKRKDLKKQKEEKIASESKPLTQVQPTVGQHPQGPPKQQSWSQVGQQPQGPPQQQSWSQVGQQPQGPPQQQSWSKVGQQPQGPPQQQSWSHVGQQPQRFTQQQSQSGQRPQGYDQRPQGYDQRQHCGQRQQGYDQRQHGGQRQQGFDQRQQGGQRQQGYDQRQHGAPQGYQQKSFQHPDNRAPQQKFGSESGSEYGGSQSGRSGDGKFSQNRGPQVSYQNQGRGFQGRGSGVSEGSEITVETNYIELNIPTHLDKAYHYDVKIEPDKPKKMFRKAVEMYCKKQFSNFYVAFDGKSLAYSSEQLPEKLLVAQTVEVVPEFGKPREFKVTLTKTKDFEIDMSILRSYGSRPEGLAGKPMRAIQCLDVILTQQCHEKGVKSGRSFFYRPDRPENLCDGYELWYGLFQAAILGQRLLLNIDVSHKSFPKPSDLVSLYEEVALGRYGRLSNFENLLKGAEVLYTPPKTFNQTPKQYKVNFLSQDNSRQYKFKADDGNMISVFDYYKSKQYTLQKPEYQLIHVGPRDGKIYLPIELCRMADNQVSNKQTGPRQVSEIIKHSAISSWERKKKILALFHYFHSKRTPIIEKFGITLGKEFIQIRATRLFAPKLEYAFNKTIKPENGSWRADNTKFFKTAPTNSELKWCVINLEKFLNEGLIRQMGQNLIRICKNTGVKIDEKPQFEIKKIDVRNISQTLGECASKYDFVIVILTQRGNTYPNVKQAAELEKGVLTQCIKADTVEKRANDSTLNNILLKLNSKLNGINQRIDAGSKTSIFSSDKSVMLIGADVTHPSPTQRNIPSIVGTCATSDPDCVRYNMQFRIQDPKKEIIVSMKDVVLEHLKIFFNDQKKYPSHIIYYRDGVADGQFEQVLNEELAKGMNLAFGEIKRQTKIDYKPKVTCVIVQKRNHTRFFPMDKGTAFGRYDNVFPGTCVTDVICHPREKEFFLVSHESIKGTARPTRYIVIKDDADFDLNDLKNVTYNLCHLFPRCNRSVSYPAPAYLAHLVAARGKVYIENTNIDMRRLAEVQQRKKIVERFSLGNPMFFV